MEVIDDAAGRIVYAVACRSDAGWTIEIAVAEQIEPSAGGDFVMASGDEAQAPTLFLAPDGDISALDAAAEAEVIEKGWPAP